MGLLFEFLPYISFFFILLGLIFWVGLISLRRLVNRDRDETLRKKLSNPVLLMSVTGLLIASICALVMMCPITCSVYEDLTMKKFDEVDCLETPITEQYKIIVTQRRNGDKEASIADVNGQVELIWVKQYSVVGNYLIGVANGGYFGLDQRTGGRRGGFDKRNEFLESLNTLGIFQVPEFLPAETICETRQCQPCATNTPSP